MTICDGVRAWRIQGVPDNKHTHVVIGLATVRKTRVLPAKRNQDQQRHRR